MRGHLRDESDGRRAAQDAGRDAAAERRVSWRDVASLVIAQGHAAILPARISHQMVAVVVAAAACRLAMVSASRSRRQSASASGVMMIAVQLHFARAAALPFDREIEAFADIVAIAKTRNRVCASPGFRFFLRRRNAMRGPFPFPLSLPAICWPPSSETMRGGKCQKRPSVVIVV